MNDLNKSDSKNEKVLLREVEIPSPIKLEILENTLVYSFKGKEFQDHLPAEVRAEKRRENLVLESKDKKMLGTVLSIARNRVQGFKEPFVKDLEIQGKGYSVKLESRTLNFKVGYSHEVQFEVDEKVEVKVLGGRRIILISHDKQLVGETAARIERIKKPNPYYPSGIYLKGKILIKKNKK